MIEHRRVNETHFCRLLKARSAYLDFNEVPDPAGLPVRGGLGRAERPDHTEAGGQVLERVGLRARGGGSDAAVVRAGCQFEQVAQNNHRGVRLAGAARAGNDDCLK